MSFETQALKNRIKRTESDIIKLQLEFQELLDRMDRLELLLSYVMHHKK